MSFEKLVSPCPRRKWVRGESLFLLCYLGSLVLEGGGGFYCWAIKAILRRRKKRKKKKNAENRAFSEGKARESEEKSWRWW